MGFFLAPPSLSLLLLMIILSVGAPPTEAWGPDGHFMICRIARNYLSEEARTAVEDLLPRRTTLEEVCSWADDVRRQYPWSAPLHDVSNPSRTCDFVHTRDCPNNECVVGAISDEAVYLRDNYYRRITPPTSSWDLSLSLKFLAHFVGDVHQPLHVGFKRDSGGNAIKNIITTWGPTQPPPPVYTLREIWDSVIISTAIRRKYGNNRETMIESIKRSIRPDDWTRASLSPALYACESIAEACANAYKDRAGRNVQPGSTLEETYYESGLIIVENRIAQAAVRLAALLNDIFRRRQIDSTLQI